MTTTKVLTFDEFKEVVEQAGKAGDMLTNPETREAYNSGVQNLALYLRRVMYEGLTASGEPIKEA